MINTQAYIDDLNMRLGEMSNITQQKMYWVDNSDPSIATSYDELFNDLHSLLLAVDDFSFSSKFIQMCKDLLLMLDLYKEPEDYFSKGDIIIIEDINWVKIVEFSKKVYSIFKEEIKRNSLY